MAYDGSGTFDLYSPGNPVVTGTTISSTWANNTLQDIANNGLSFAVTKNGQTTTTLRIPFAEGIATDTILEETSGAGVTVDGVLIKDSEISSTYLSFLQAGTGAVERTGQSKLREQFSIADFGAVGDGVTNSTAAIQAAHDAAVAAGEEFGMTEVLFPAGTYIITSLEWSPLVTIRCLGSVVLQTAIASGKGIYFSTEFGNWDTSPKQIDYNSNKMVTGGKLTLQNTNGANTATGMFLGEDGTTGAYSCESVMLESVHLIGWSKSHQYGSQAYLITWMHCRFVENTTVIYLDETGGSGYVDRLERITYIDPTFSQNTNVIDGGNANGDLVFIAASCDYNTGSVLAEFTCSTKFTFIGLHLEAETSSDTFFKVKGCVVHLEDYTIFVPGVGTGANPLIGEALASGTLVSRRLTAITPSGATLFDCASSTGFLDVDDEYVQQGGAAASYYTNTGSGSALRRFQSTAVNKFTMGPDGNVRVRASGVYLHDISKTNVANGATVDLFSVGPIVSWASGRLTAQSTSAGIVTVKIIDFVIMGAGTPGGTNVTATEDYSGGASTFTVGETANSPSAGYNKISLTNTSGATCSFTCSLQVNYLSAGGAVTLL